MASFTPTLPWIPEDDLLLKSAVEAGASLEALAKGAVRFSRKFTVGELRDRWQSLLYDDDVSAEASARMVEFEHSNKPSTSTSSRFGVFKGGASVGGSPAKRKAESIRRQYYERRKRLCSFNTYNLSFIDEPIANNELLDGNYVVGNHVENYFGFEDKDLNVVDHVSADAVGVSDVDSLLDIHQKGTLLSGGGFVENGRQQNVELNNGDQQLLRSGDGLIDFGNCSNVEEAGTSHTMPDMPLWKTIEDVPAPEMPMDVVVKCRVVEEDDGNNISSPGYSHLTLGDSLVDTEMNRSGDDFADLSDSLLNLTNENEPVVVVADGENMKDKYSYHKSLLLNSPKDVNGDHMSNVCQPETLDGKTINDVSGGVSSAGKNDNANVSQSGGGNQHSVSCSEINIPSVPNPRSTELYYENMECTLNTEDPEVPCNDDMIQPRFTEYRDPATSFLNKKNGRQENTILKKEEKVADPIVASKFSGQRMVPKSSPSFSLVGCGVKEESSDGNHLASVSKQAKEIHVDPSQSRCVHAIPKYLANQVPKQEGIPAPVTIRGKHALLSTELGSAGPVLLEPEANPSTLDQDESEEEPDGGNNHVPSFSDIENMILEMDLSPDDEDQYISKEVLRYQHEDAKRKIMRLEQCARASMQRAIASKGAFAILYGRHSKQYIKKPEVILGRATEDNEVDIDLGKEGPANKISRRQALIKMEGDGSFFLTNIAKSSIFVNGKEIATGHRMCLSSSSLIEIREMSFVFEMNHKSVKRYLENIGINNKQKYTKFEWS
ncbi:uncharacterized protein LOC133812722 [Humulus lupulus]|uniref:uncharacterized protein LOC133812722 n=1 Tax=Humulus lupulus TaxID=3486 RepID=UPI002B408C17|nr:uncharacterized protein LOC133812722 [Humulus lupulus]XP_062102511.1 uncharacterized protein LOC133812722 [Humulus lupulus]